MRFLKRLFYKILVWFHKRGIGSARFLIDHVFGGNGGGEAGDNFQKLVKYRQYEIPFNNPPRKLQITGDSIIHLGEAHFEDLGYVCSAIGGDTTESLYHRLDKNVFPYLSTHLLIDIGGNDILRGDTPEVAFDRFKRIVGECRKRGIIHIGVYEILPLGNPDTAVEPIIKEHADLIKEANFKLVPELNRLYHRFAQAGGCYFIPVRHLMEGQDGYIRSDYGTSDKIHVNDKCYREVYAPLAQKWAKSTGAL